MYGVKPSVSHMRVFGSIAIALDKTQKTKFRAKAKEYVMVGYAETSKGYRLYDKESRKIVINRDVKFIEKNMSNSPDVTILVSGSENGSNKDEDAEESPETKRECKVKEEFAMRGPGGPKFLRNGKVYNTLNMVLAENMCVPNTVGEALSGSYAQEWLNAMTAE